MAGSEKRGAGADLLRRLTRYRERLQAEGRKRAVTLIDAEIAKLQTTDPAPKK